MKWFHHLSESHTSSSTKERAWSTCLRWKLPSSTKQSTLTRENFTIWTFIKHLTLFNFHSNFLQRMNATVLKTFSGWHSLQWRSMKRTLFIWGKLSVVLLRVNRPVQVLLWKINKCAECNDNDTFEDLQRWAFKTRRIISSRFGL